MNKSTTNYFQEFNLSQADGRKENYNKLQAKLTLLNNRGGQKGIAEQAMLREALQQFKDDANYEQYTHQLATQSPERNHNPDHLPQADVKSVSIGHNIIQNNQTGMVIRGKFSVKNLKNVHCISIAYFYFVDGTPLQDTNGQYSDQSGYVSVNNSFTPQYETRGSSNFKMFMPYDELHIGEGHHDLKLRIRLYNSSTYSFLADSEDVRFYLDNPTAPSPLPLTIKPRRKANFSALLCLVLGVVSFFWLHGSILSIICIIVGHRVRKRIKNSYDKDGYWIASLGLVLSYLSVLLPLFS